MERKLFTLFAMLAITIAGFSQNKTLKHLSGYVTDSATHESIPFANIKLKAAITGTFIAATETDIHGGFIFNNLPDSKISLSIDAVGYQTVTIFITPDALNGKALQVKLPRNLLVLDEVVVSARQHATQRMGALSEAIHATTVITPEQIFMKNASTFSQAVESEPGVCVLTGCSSCGFKQIQINGLGANQTTLLVDGLPLYTDVTNFYGVDALTTAGLTTIDIARGPGASLLSPGALGGTMDVRFQDPTKNSTMVDGAAGNNQYNRLSVVATALDTNSKIGIIVAAHYFENGAWDANGTGLSQSPYMQDESALMRLNGWLGPKDKLAWNLQFIHSNNEIFGASTTTNFHGATLGTPDSLSTQMFAGGNVKNKFIGNPIDILEWIQTKRDQIQGTLTLYNSKNSTLQFHGGYVNQTQGSTYEGGADYSNTDNTVATDLRYQKIMGHHTLSLGGDFNSEILRSQSYYYYSVLGVTPDSYNSFWGGAYVQDSWNFGHQRQLDVAVRADRIVDTWVDKPNSTIDKFIVAPRINFVWEFIEGLTGRLSAGEGWRSPLSFFELDHGLLNNGFDVAVTQLERGWGGGGSLSWTPNLWTFTGSVYGTSLTGLEYVGANPNPLIQRPILLSDSTKMFFLDFDFQVDRIVNKWLEVGIGIAHQDIPNSFKAVEIVAAQETEANAHIAVTLRHLTFSSDVQWIASRNLFPYGYGGQYNEFSNGVASDPKLTTAPSYAVINAKAVYHVTRQWDVYVGGENLTNYTQAGTAHDEPHYFDQNGNFNTSHIWGPLRGRQLYLGIRVKI